MRVKKLDLFLFPVRTIFYYIQFFVFLEQVFSDQKVIVCSEIMKDQHRR